MRPYLVIFDCDGVLVDTEGTAARVMAQAISDIGLPTTIDECMRLYRGRSTASCVALIEERLGHALPASWLPDLRLKFDAAFAQGVAPIAGVSALIDAIEDASIPFCVASSSSPARMTQTLGLAGLLPHFEGRLFSATMVQHGKPAPDLFLYAARAMDVAPADCVVIEDSLPGVTAGQTAGMRVIGYCGDRWTNPDELRARCAHIVFETREIVPLLAIS